MPDAHIVIIGNGIAGVTAARHIRKLSDQKITIISAESKYFFSRTALMYVFMGHMKFEHTQPYENDFWAKSKIDLLEAYVEKVDASNNCIFLSDGMKLNYDALVIATGSKTSMFDWPGQNARGVVGLYSKQDLEQLDTLSCNAKAAAIIGGGLIGIELAEMLHSRHIPVTMLVRETSFWNTVLPKEESEMVNREIRKHHIDLRLGEEMQQINTIQNQSTGITTKAGKIIAADIVGITTGVTPNIAFLKDSGIETDKGVLVNAHLETNIKGIYAIGDCAQQRKPLPGRKAIEAVWYTGRMMGETIALTLTGQKTNYNPGPWFNSAKFFNIEYMTYGTVLPNDMEGITQLYWEHKTGDKAVRFAYDTNTEEFLGVNLMGIRMRHQYFHEALINKLTISNVLGNLKKANFDPEFYRSFHNEIKRSFTAQAVTN